MWRTSTHGGSYGRFRENCRLHCFMIGSKLDCLMARLPHLSHRSYLLDVAYFVSWAFVNISLSLQRQRRMMIILWGILTITFSLDPFSSFCDHRSYIRVWTLLICLWGICKKYLSALQRQRRMVIIMMNFLNHRCVDLEQTFPLNPLSSFCDHYKCQTPFSIRFCTDMFLMSVILMCTQIKNVGSFVKSTDS